MAYILRITTDIIAPIERCFDLARSVEAHVASAAWTRERVVAGRASGLFELGDEVTWEALHPPGSWVGVRQRLTSRVTRCERPWLLQDQMVRGRSGRWSTITFSRRWARDGHGWWTS